MLRLDVSPTNPYQRIYKKLLRIIRDYKRNVLISKFLKTHPAPLTHVQQDFSIHMLCCSRDLNIGICAIKSFILATQKSYTFVFHDDGSLSNSDIVKLQHHIPNSIVIKRADADKEINGLLQDYPSIKEWRKNFKLALKVIDVAHFATNTNVLYIDSDILFFKEPDFIVKHINGDVNYFNKDIETSYITDIDSLKRAFEINILENINTGLWIAKKDIFDLKIIESFLSDTKYKEFEKLRKHVSEQTLITLLASVSSKYQTKLLPQEYDVDLYKLPSSTVCKHYVGKIRFGLEIEGLEYLLNRKNFIKGWLQFVSKFNDN